MAPLDLALHHARLDHLESELYHVLAHPVRVRLLHVLDADGSTAADIAARFGLTPAGAAAHLAALTEVGLLRHDDDRYVPRDPSLLEAFRRLRTFVRTVP